MILSKIILTMFVLGGGLALFGEVIDSEPVTLVGAWLALLGVFAILAFLIIAIWTLGG